MQSRNYSLIHTLTPICYAMYLYMVTMFTAWLSLLIVLESLLHTKTFREKNFVMNRQTLYAFNHRTSKSILSVNALTSYLYFIHCNSMSVSFVMAHRRSICSVLQHFKRWIYRSNKHLLHLCVRDFLWQFVSSLHCLELVGRTLAFRNVWETGTHRRVPGERMLLCQSKSLSSAEQRMDSVAK